MTNVSNVQAPVEALPDEVDSQKRHWLQAFHPPVERVTAPQVQEAASPESIVADFIRQHSASGHLVARSVFLQPPYSVPEADLSALLDVLCQDANNADITRVQGAEDAYFYSTQTMTANYAGMCVQVVENDICRAIAEAVRLRLSSIRTPELFRLMSWNVWTTTVTALEDNPMSFTRRKFVIGMGTVIFFTGPGQNLLASTRSPKAVRYVMIHDESLCNGCNICARACRKTNHVPDQGSRLSIAHIPVTDNDNETLYHYFRQSCQHCDDAPCIEVCPTGASWRDENGIVRVDTSCCIGCSYCIGACPYQVRYLNPQTKVADKCDFCAESRLAKGFPPICVNACPEHALIFGREDSPEIQTWLRENKYYEYQLAGAGKPHLYRRFGQHLIKKENV